MYDGLLEQGLQLIHQDICTRDGVDGRHEGIVLWIRFLNNCDEDMPEMIAADAVASVSVKKRGQDPQDGIRVVGGGHQWPNRILGIADGPQVDVEVERVCCQGNSYC